MSGAQKRRRDEMEGEGIVHDQQRRLKMREEYEQRLQEKDEALYGQFKQMTHEEQE